MLMRPVMPQLDRPLPLQQSDGFARALTLLGRSAAVEGVHDCGQVLVVSRPLGPLGTLRFASRGPVFRHDTPPADRVAALRGARLHLVNADAGEDAILRGAGFHRIMTPATLAVLPLDPDPDRQLALCDAAWRNKVRQGRRASLRITLRPLCPQRDAWFLAADLEQQRHKRFRALPHAVSLAFARANPGDALVLTAMEGPVPVAAMLILRHGQAATYQIAWSGPRGRSLRAHPVLLMEAARRLAATGVTELDLGTIDTDAGPGLARFKLGSGATVRRLGGTWLRLPGWHG
ncbi:GNAT family N-acetyltransferase [Loktanella sp. M215]|uniref:GNAT family N-acetyltransferase n=1 Tax=Loktanella sp. M215 TaxID=2675431 RepID=UPI001F1F5FC1|nr:GNAT family N-acetyltransferase [Loktanella sp. M215]MCF7700159.1 GNAT family N-acetyltransferase [Loktanella sp. M215]